MGENKEKDCKEQTEQWAKKLNDSLMDTDAVKKTIPQVSIIIPVYNASAMVERCARSLFEQSLQSMQIIFVDDCSCDDSVEVITNCLEDYPERNGQVKIIRCEKNGGSSKARNIGLRHAIGKYVAFADADDYLDKDGIEAFYHYAADNDLDIAYCDHFGGPRVDINTRTSQDFSSSNVVCVKSMLVARNWREGMQGYCWNKIYRRSFLEESRQTFLEGADLWEDLGLNIRLFAITDKIGYAKDVCYYHYDCMGNTTSLAHNNSMMKDVVIKHNLDRKHNLDTAIDFLKSKDLDAIYAKEIMECKCRIKNYFLRPNRSFLSYFVKIYPETNEHLLARCSYSSLSLSCNRVIMRRLLNGHIGEYLFFYRIKSLIKSPFK